MAAPQSRCVSRRSTGLSRLNIGTQLWIRTATPDHASMLVLTLIPLRSTILDAAISLQPTAGPP